MNLTPDWQRIQSEAKQQSAAEVAVLRETPLVYGEHIAWAETSIRSGYTDGLSPVHRVGVPQKDEPYTTCGVAIPGAVRWVPLSPALVRVMEHCRWCEAEHSRLFREDAA